MPIEMGVILQDKGQQHQHNQEATLASPRDGVLDYIPVSHTAIFPIYSLLWVKIKF